MSFGDDWMYAEMEERARVPRPRPNVREEAEREIAQEDAAVERRKLIDVERAKIIAWRKLPWWRRLFSKP